jgi:hypothetical protein
MGNLGSCVTVGSNNGTLGFHGCVSVVSNNGISGSIVVRNAEDRQTDMDRLIRCSSLTIEHEERLKTYIFTRTETLCV